MLALFAKLMAGLEAFILLMASVFSPATVNNERAYATELEESGIFANAYADALAQTEVYQMIENHFSQESGKEKKCLIIGYDGARAEACLNMVDGESGIQLLQQTPDGGLYHMYTGGDFPLWQDSSTAPGWATMLTGRWALGCKGHGVTGNGVVKSLRTRTVLTNLVEAGTIDKTAFLVSWSGHFAAENATYLKEVSYTEEQGYAMRWDTFGNDDAVFAAALAEVQAPDSSDIIFPILEQCDHAGHDTGFGNQNPEYVAGFQASDKMAYDLIQAVMSRETYDEEDWLILITSDHGGNGTGHGGISSYERRIFLASNQGIQ